MMDELNLPAECYGFPFQPACWMTDIGRQILVLININVNAKCIHLEVNSGNLTKDI